jgi:hypothetical protein
MVQPTCRTLRPRLTKVVAAASGFVDQFSREHPHALVNTIFWAMNYEITKPLELFVQNSFLLHGVTAYPLCHYSIRTTGLLDMRSKMLQNVSCEISK